MTQRDPAPAGETTPPNTGPAHEPPPPGSYAAESASSQEDSSAPAGDSSASTSTPASTKVRGSANDPLRGSFTSHTWIAVIVLIVVMVLLAVFVLQNTQDVEVSYFGATGNSPLAAALLIAFAAGLLVAGVAGTLRIWQLRRRVRKQAH